MIDFVVSLLIPDFSGRRERRQARVFDSGGEVVFEACLLGDQGYCRATIIFIAASRVSLHVAPTEVKELGRFRLPSERLEFRQARDRRKSDPRIVRPYWTILECRDGENEVLIACAPQNARYVTAALASKDRDSQASDDQSD
ncbi:hypothetical protein [Streptomyces sp. NPDC059906]|uniref:hypothetical protein n=1 Tax=Streptomyces sp. NPDC059906 TaxID=3346997 RepID=UPI00365ED856